MSAAERPYKETRQMPKRETAAEREARYCEEVQANMARFEAEKPLRLLRVLARAQVHGLPIYIYYYERINDVRIRVVSNDPYGGVGDQYLNSYYSELNEVQMSNIEYDIDALDEELKEKQRLAELKKVALAKLTKEEQQLLGLV
jgi:hypothetical protein